jgi:hypothetical protein
VSADPKRKRRGEATVDSGSRLTRLKGAGLLAAALITATALALLVQGSEAEPRTPNDAPAAEADALPNDLPPGHPPIDGVEEASEAMDLPAGHPPIGASAEEPGALSSPLNAKDALSIAAIFAQASRLEGKTVGLRVKVTKRTLNVLGRTWLHVQDGSGSAESGDHDLVVTTQAAPEVGEIVVLEGRVVTNKDLGSGYRYDVLLEDATVRKETAPSEDQGRARSTP